MSFSPRFSQQKNKISNQMSPRSFPREQENLRDEYRKVLVEYRKAIQENSLIEQQLRDSQLTLEEAENYNEALVESTRGKNDGLIEYNELLKNFKDVEYEIEVKQSEFNELKKSRSDLSIAHMNSEKNWLLLEIMKLNEIIDSRSSTNSETKIGLAEKLSSDLYDENQEKEMLILFEQKKKQNLRKKLNTIKASLDCSEVPSVSADEESEKYRKEMQKNSTLKQEIQNLQTKLMNRREKNALYLQLYLKTIEDLNYAMKLLSIDGQVDVKELEKKIFNENEENAKNKNKEKETKREERRKKKAERHNEIVKRCLREQIIEKKKKKTEKEERDKMERKKIKEAAEQREREFAERLKKSQEAKISAPADQSVTRSPRPLF